MLPTEQCCRQSWQGAGTQITNTVKEGEGVERLERQQKEAIHLEGGTASLAEVLPGL